MKRFISIVILIAYFYEERWSWVVSFSNPWDDVRGTDYQLINALVASVQGSFSGLGIGESTQKYYFLPESHTDFIFSILVSLKNSSLFSNRYNLIIFTFLGSLKAL